MDIRGARGYIGMPGSILRIQETNGPYKESLEKTYEYNQEDIARMKPFPEWLCSFMSTEREELMEEEDDTPEIQPISAPTRLATKTLIECLEKIIEAPKGSRNATLYAMGQRLFRFTPRYFSREDILEACILNAVSAGLRQDEATSTARSAMTSYVASMKVFFSDDPEYERFTGVPSAFPCEPQFKQENTPGM